MEEWKGQVWGERSRRQEEVSKYEDRGDPGTGEAHKMNKGNQRGGREKCVWCVCNFFLLPKQSLLKKKVLPACLWCSPTLNPSACYAFTAELRGTETLSGRSPQLPSAPSAPVIIIIISRTLLWPLCDQLTGAHSVWEQLDLNGQQRRPPAPGHWGDIRSLANEPLSVSLFLLFPLFFSTSLSLSIFFLFPLPPTISFPPNVDQHTTWISAVSVRLFFPAVWLPW